MAEYVALPSTTVPGEIEDQFCPVSPVFLPSFGRIAAARAVYIHRVASTPTFRSIIRGLLQVWAWLLLVFLFAADYKTVEYLKHGPDIIHFDNEGRILRRPPLSVRDWAGPVVLVVVQGLVMWALYRSYRRKPNIHPR